MQFRINTGGYVQGPGAELLVVPVFEDTLGTDSMSWALHRLNESYEGRLINTLKEEAFTGKSGETAILNINLWGTGNKRLLVVGMGKLADFTLADTRILTYALAKQARKCNAKIVGVAPPFLVPEHEATVFQHLSEGLVLGGYDPGIHQKDRKAFPVTKLFVMMLGELGDFTEDLTEHEAETALKADEIIANAVNTARDLVNRGPNEVTPKDLAVFATRIADAHGERLTVRILAKGECKKLGMNLFLAVAAGSNEDPRFIHMIYKPSGRKKPKRRIALIGKGITFDSGGLGIKTGEGMLHMKYDMAGGAAVLAAMEAIATFKLPGVEVHAIVAATENMPSGKAYRPGDVYTAMDGTTVEIGHTDAEGRLTLADAIAYAKKVVKADLILELSTLTGAARIALGLQTAAFTTKDDELATYFSEAAAGAGEQVWRLPLTREAAELNKSTVADIKNIGSMAGIAGALTAAQFLQHFAEGTPYVHCDIAGPAHADEPWGMHPKGGTGFGLMTFVEFVTKEVVRAAT